MGFNDIHLRVFFVSLSIFVLSFCGWYYLVSLTDPYTYKGDDGYVKSFISLITPDEGEKKTLVDIKLLFRSGSKYEEENVVAVTNKTIDLKNRGIWLTDSQCDIAIMAEAAAMLAVFIYLFTGLGIIFEKLRPIFLESVGLLFLFPPFGAAVLIVEILAVALIGFLLPLYLFIELILGIVPLLPSLSHKKYTMHRPKSTESEYRQPLNTNESSWKPEDTQLRKERLEEISKEFGMPVSAESSFLQKFIETIPFYEIMGEISTYYYETEIVSISRELQTLLKINIVQNLFLIPDSELMDTLNTNQALYLFCNLFQKDYTPKISDVIHFREFLKINHIKKVVEPYLIKVQEERTKELEEYKEYF